MSQAYERPLFSPYQEDWTLYPKRIKQEQYDFLINNDILVLEDMKLENINITPNLVIVAPLQIKAVDGVPCNVIAY